MQSDIVDFQRRGWSPEEIMAGLCNVLPKNIWLYVAQIPNLAALGRRFLLQGGTQYNLAAVKAQVDYIQSRFGSKSAAPEVIVHEHCGEAGAIGAALEAGRLWSRGRLSTFIGVEALAHLSYKTTREEATRCYFCKNECLRTFIDVKTNMVSNIQPAVNSKVPLEPGSRRFIVATCEKGTVEDVRQMREIKGALESVKKENVNFAEFSAHEVFRIPDLPGVSDPPKRFVFGAARRNRSQTRSSIRIGMPRVLNMYSTAPLFTGYFVSLGIKAENLLFSEFTSELLYREGAKRGSIDPCFPSKLGIPHIHNLLTAVHARKPLDIIFFPMVDCLPSALTDTQASRACPTVTATPAAVKAAYTKEGDLFAESGVRFLSTFVNTSRPELLERQLWSEFEDLLGLSPGEHHRAILAGYANLDRYNALLRTRGREVLERLEREGGLGVVLLGRPYHNDPGVNHGIPEELQKLGYPVFTQDSLPVDRDTLQRWFEDDLDAMSIADVWKNSYSENTSRKVWAAKYVARHPNLVALELSSFKCGHDAPIYSVVEEIIAQSGTPYFCFKDIDENKPSGSIKLRIETIDYFLRRYREDMLADNDKRSRIESRLASFAANLRFELARGTDKETIDVPLAALQSTVQTLG
jgi:predicted nucleotide-binding protein (sugar kinase/HSP70/actin superfamily)